MNLFSSHPLVHISSKKKKTFIIYKYNTYGSYKIIHLMIVFSRIIAQRRMTEQLWVYRVSIKFDEFLLSRVSICVIFRVLFCMNVRDGHLRCTFVFDFDTPEGWEIRRVVARSYRYRCILVSSDIQMLARRRKKDI